MEVLNLPEEIQMNILSCLPVKSLLRFRCVSKQFRSLISDPYFVKCHLNRSLHSKNYQKVFNYQSSLGNRKKKNALVGLDCPWYVGSCNGLICYVDNQFKVIIYNPSTRVSKELPKPPISPIHSYYGFGFDSSDNDYKVVLGMEVVADTSKSIIIFHMFCLRHNHWRRIQDLSWRRIKLWWRCNYLGRFLSRGIGTFFNGALHWLIKPMDIGSEKLPVVMVSFDLSNEVFSEMSLDNIQGQTDLEFYMLGAFDEYLYALASSFTGNGTSVEVWLTKEYGGKASWAKFITVPCNAGNTCLKPLCFLRNGELLVAIDQCGYDRIQLESYNTKTKEFTRVRSCPRFSQAVMYAESLVNPTALM